MNPLVQSRLPALVELCRRFGVRRLELFGSAATEHFDLRNSDLDFLVEFDPQHPLGPFRQFIDFLLALEQLFDRPVDLVETQTLRNPYLIQSIQTQRQLLYAA